MKKIIKVEDLCCKRCATRAAEKLELADGIRAARGDYKKNVILVEHDDRITDREMCEIVEQAGFKVLSVEIRKGLFY